MKEENSFITLTENVLQIQHMCKMNSLDTAAPLVSVYCTTETFEHSDAQKHCKHEQKHKCWREHNKVTKTDVLLLSQEPAVGK